MIYLALFVLGLTFQFSAAMLMTFMLVYYPPKDKQLWWILGVVLWLKTISRVAVIPVLEVRNDIDLLVIFVAQFLPMVVALLLLSFVIKLYRNVYNDRIHPTG